MVNLTVEEAKAVLERLIENSGASFSAEEVLLLFRQRRDNNLNRKLLKILRIITKNEINAATPLAEVTILLDKKEPFQCLLQFLHYFPYIKPNTSSNTIESTSPSKSSAPVAEIKERVLQAASCGLSKSARSSLSNASFSTTPNTSIPSQTFSSGTIPKPKLLWNIDKADLTATPNLHLRRLPAGREENSLVYDLIHCLIGMQGIDVSLEESDNKIEFKISDHISLSLKNLANEILPLAGFYIRIQDFFKESSTTNCGQVTQALAAHMRKLIREYHMLLVQLEDQFEKGVLNLYKMVYYCRPAMKIMGILVEIIIKINEENLRGGGVLTLLCNKINALTGDNLSQELLIRLTQLSAVPYMDILQLWIQKGVIDDPQNEFLVEDNEEIRIEKVQEHYSANYWEKRYTIRHERTPSFLQNYEGIILRTGKYLNVIRQCGKNVVVPKTVVFKFSPLDENHLTVIKNAYRFASKTLLEVLIKENDLMGHMLSVRRYFLMQQGDFITQFMDACEEELCKNLDKVLPIRLENLLGLTLRLSSAKHDPYKEELHCDLLTYDLVTQMTKIINEEEHSQIMEFHDLHGLECFAFRYDVKWPVSLVLNHIAISKYQMLFRQLFYFKHVERQLCIVWRENCIAKKFSPEAAKLYRPAFTLRQRMMNAIQNVEYYMMIEVIEPNWHIFLGNMQTVENVDDVLRVHQDFLDLCLKNCMLTNPTLLKNLVKLCNICLKFCEFMQSESALAPTETFSERVRRFDFEFTEVLMKSLSQISDVASLNLSDRFMNLVHRINFNSFYNDHLQSS